jgi:hypothetical protein
MSWSDGVRKYGICDDVTLKDGRGHCGNWIEKGTLTKEEQAREEHPKELTEAEWKTLKKKVEGVCLWDLDTLDFEVDGYYRTSCGNLPHFEEGGPKENGIKYCPYCGKELEVAEQKKEEEE